MAKKKAAPKKTTAKSSPTATAAKKAPSKPAKKSKASAAKHTHTDDCEHEEMELDAIETKAFDLALDNEAIRDELEDEASKALANVVQKVLKKHKTSLNATQAHNVAMVLFSQD